MKMTPRAAAGIMLAIGLCAGFLGFCVRIVPGDMPTSAGRGEPLAASAPGGPLLIPVEDVPANALVDTFAQARANGARPHDAIDIMAAKGRAVIAAADGRIEKLFWSESGGRTIYERSVDGRRIYYYAHLDSYARGLREGQTVRRGARIGAVGSTGNADPAAPHLHFAISAVAPGDPWHGGTAINPYPLLTGAH